MINTMINNQEIELKVKNKNTILVIGNGWDLAHTLATSYDDFCRFIELTLQLKNKKNEANIILKKNKMYYKEDLRELIKNHEFAKKRALSKNAVKLISNVIDDNEYCGLYLQMIENNELVYSIMEEWKKNGKVGAGIEEYLEKLVKENSINNEENSLLNRNLILLKIAFNFYLLEIVINCQVRDIVEEFERTNGRIASIIPIQEGLKNHREEISDIISFNYTNIMPLYMDKNINYYYMNGQLLLWNIVLGIDDNNDSRFDKMKKSYQICKTKKELIRVYEEMPDLDEQRKAEIEKYLHMNFEDLLRNINEDRLVLVFGHSLGSADATILKKILGHKHTKINIYYRFDEAIEKHTLNNKGDEIARSCEFESMVKKLKEILGEDNKKLNGIDRNESNEIRLVATKSSLASYYNIKQEIGQIEPRDLFNQINQQTEILKQYNSNEISLYERVQEMMLG